MVTINRALSNKDLVIRPAVPKDADACRNIAANAYGKYIDRMNKKPAPMVADFATHIAKDTTLVAETDGQVIGYAVVMESDEGFLLDNIAIHDRHQGEGWGRRLIKAVEAHIQVCGGTSYELYTNIHMTENLALYPALGFNETKRVIEKGFSRVYFRKDLV